MEMKSEEEREVKAKSKRKRGGQPIEKGKKREYMGGAHYGFVVQFLDVF